MDEGLPGQKARVAGLQVLTEGKIVQPGERKRVTGGWGHVGHTMKNIELICIKALMYIV